MLHLDSDIDPLLFGFGVVFIACAIAGWLGWLQ